MVPASLYPAQYGQHTFIYNQLGLPLLPFPMKNDANKSQKLVDSHYYTASRPQKHLFRETSENSGIWNTGKQAKKSSLGSLIKDHIRELSEEPGRRGKAQSSIRQAIVLKHPAEAGPKLSKLSPSALSFIHLLHAALTLLAFQKGKLTWDIKLNALLSISACWNVLQSQSTCA